MQALIQKIIIPVDFSAPSERAARFGCALAQKLGAHVYLIHVLDAPDHAPMHPRASRIPLRRPYVELKSALDLFADRLDPGGAMTTEIRTGPVDDAIRSAAIAYGADLVVMATRGRTGIPHMIFGSVAEQVIRTAPCPVLVMRDSGRIGVHQPVEQAPAIPAARTA